MSLGYIRSLKVYLYSRSVGFSTIEPILLQNLLRLTRKLPQKTRINRALCDYYHPRNIYGISFSELRWTCFDNRTKSTALDWNLFQSIPRRAAKTNY